MSTKQKYRRFRVFADAQMQTSLCIRIVIYWVVCQLSIFATISLLASLDGPAGSLGDVTRFIVPAAIVSSCLLPLVLVDQLVFSNRFAGPLLNFRRKFARFVKEGAVEKVNFRTNDLYQDIQENYNELCERFTFENETHCGSDPSVEENTTNEDNLDKQLTATTS